MEGLYMFVGNIILISGISLVLWLVFYNLFLLIKRWVDDAEGEYYYPSFFKYIPPICISIRNHPSFIEGVEIFFFFPVFLLLWTIGCAFLWPLAIPVALIWVSLYSLRYFVRFKKKVNKALKGKNTENHTHEWGE